MREKSLFSFGDTLCSREKEKKGANFSSSSAVFFPSSPSSLECVAWRRRRRRKGIILNKIIIHFEREEGLFLSLFLLVFPFAGEGRERKKCNDKKWGGEKRGKRSGKREEILPDDMGPISSSIFSLSLFHPRLSLSLPPVSDSETRGPDLYLSLHVSSPPSCSHGESRP